MYQCKKCGREFKEKRYLAQHHNRKTPCGNDLQCKKCFNSFANIWSLQRHMKRKTPCAPEEIPVIIGGNPENRCQFCNRTYSTPSSLKRHQKTCDREANLTVIAELVKEVQELKQQLAVPNHTTNVHNDNRQLNINFVNFPLQDMSAIDMKKILRIVDQHQENEIIPAIVEHLHGNPDHPEQQNIFMARRGADVTIVYCGDDEKTWQAIPKKQAFGHLRTEAMGLLTHQTRPIPNFQLLEAAHDTQHRDTSYQDKILKLAENDTTEDTLLEKKLVDFGETFHKQRLKTIIGK